MADKITVGNQRRTLGELSKLAFDAFGGPEGFFTEVRAEYDNAPSGGMARTRLLTSILNLSATAEKTDRPPEVTEMDAELLEEELLRIDRKRNRYGEKEPGTGITESGPGPVEPGAAAGTDIPPAETG